MVCGYMGLGDDTPIILTVLLSYWMEGKEEEKSR